MNNEHNHFPDQNNDQSTGTNNTPSGTGAGSATGMHQGQNESGSQTYSTWQHNSHGTYQSQDQAQSQNNGPMHNWQNDQAQSQNNGPMHNWQNCSRHPIFTVALGAFLGAALPLMLFKIGRTYWKSNHTPHQRCKEANSQENTTILATANFS